MRLQEFPTCHELVVRLLGGRDNAAPLFLKPTENSNRYQLRSTKVTKDDDYDVRNTNLRRR